MHRGRRKEALAKMLPMLYKEFVSNEYYDYRNSGAGTPIPGHAKITQHEIDWVESQIKTYTDEEKRELQAFRDEMAAEAKARNKIAIEDYEKRRDKKDRPWVEKVAARIDKFLKN